MPRKNRINSVANSFAQHAVSGLALIHPTLGRYAKSRGIKSVTIDLLAKGLPEGLPIDDSPVLSSESAMKEKFSEILSSEGFNLSDLTSAHLTFLFAETNWPKGAHVFIKTANGDDFETTVNQMGRRAHLLYPQKS